MGDSARGSLAVYSARPTIQVDGQEDERVSELLLSLRMQEQEGGLSNLELALSDWAAEPNGRSDFAFGAASPIQLGAGITVHTGAVGAQHEIFRGTISALEFAAGHGGPPQLVLQAEDALNRARMARRTRLHENVSIADVARNIASDLGLTPVIGDLDPPTGIWAQINESDLAFLRRLLRRCDGDLQVVGTELHVFPAGEFRRNEVELGLYNQISSVRVVADLAEQVTEVMALGWDAAAGQAINESWSTDPATPGQGQSGAQALGRAQIERVERIGHLAFRDSTEAREVARAAFEQRASRFVTLRATIEGNPQVRVGTHVRVSDLEPRFNNTYYVSQAIHRYDLVQGYQTEVTAHCPFLAS
jgi:phage protein D